MISSEKVDKMFQDCLDKTKNVAGSFVRVSGPFSETVFCVDALKNRQQEIQDTLNSLHQDFKKTKGGLFGLAFYDMANIQWTSCLLRVEKLILLGLATGQMRCLTKKRHQSINAVFVPRYNIVSEPEKGFFEEIFGG